MAIHIRRRELTVTWQRGCRAAVVGASKKQMRRLPDLASAVHRRPTCRGLARSTVAVV
jgi:hypothetical protein